jgi:diadenosine tetraphosphatase ApaH/serine/threonine PP2A family protein phosphatase
MTRATRYAIIGDIHGNWEALTAVLKDCEANSVEAYICIGDIVGYNADPGICVDKIRELNCICVSGNHDYYCSHSSSLDDFHPLAADVISWTREQLTAEQIQFLRNLELTKKVAGFTIVHSTLDMPEKWGYVFDSLEADASLSYQTTSVCFSGHTHVPVVFEKASTVRRLPPNRVKIVTGKKYFINVGSIGQPRDGDPRACYVLYDLKNQEVVYRRIPYDIATTQTKIRKANLPERLARRLEIGR